ncbi:MAG: Inner rane transport permease YbhR [Pseudomonadota bacterium]|jgi:ABC-2 type transport system permease protein
MSVILTIAKRDLKAYFVSPKGGAILFFFLIFMGSFFQNFVASYVEYQQRAASMGGQAPTLEQLIRAFFYNFNFIMILVIPAVTMALFSEDKRNGSLRLLQTAPVSAAQIVLGKFMAAVSIMTIVLVASSVYPLYLVKYGNPDTAIIGTSLLGIFLLMTSQLAFGLWVSSLTSNQFLAFLFTMFGLFLLLVLNWLAPSLTGGGIAEKIIKYIASTDHLDVFLKGMISVSNLTYFLCFTGLFLFLTNVSLDSERWR